MTTNGKSAVSEIKKRSGWNGVKAVKNNEVYDVDPDLVTRPGPRLIKGVEELAEHIYPDVFKNNRFAAYAFSLMFLSASVLMGISIGSLEIPIPSIIKVFLNEWFGIQGLNPDTTEANIIMKIRLPRVVLAALVGAGLAAAGAGFQGLLKNPLADPYTLGISSGAAVGAVVTLFFGIQLPVIGSFTLPFLSVAAAVVVIFLVLFFARLVHPSLTLSALILTGIIFSSFLGALISLMIALTGDDLKPIVHWLLGSVSMRGWGYIALFLPFLRLVLPRF